MARRIDNWTSAITLLTACAWISACGGAPADEAVGRVTPTDPTVVVDVPTQPPVEPPVEPPTQPPVEPPVEPPTQPPVEPAAPSVSVAFAVAAQDGSLQPATTASILATQAMYVVADWRDLPADAAEQLLLVAPSGSLYLSPTFPLVDGQGATVESLPDGTVRATYRVAIWGTTIASYRRTGTWTATVNLVDGSASASATIDLTR